MKDKRIWTRLSFMRRTNASASASVVNSWVYSPGAVLADEVGVLQGGAEVGGLADTFHLAAQDEAIDEGPALRDPFAVALEPSADEERAPCGDEVGGQRGRCIYRGGQCRGPYVVR